eukprot:2153202-Karenia_brevis.AAC.1
MIHDALFVSNVASPAQVLACFGQIAAQNGHWALGVSVKEQTDAATKAHKLLNNYGFDPEKPFDISPCAEAPTCDLFDFFIE